MWMRRQLRGVVAVQSAVIGEGAADCGQAAAVGMMTSTCMRSLGMFEETRRCEICQKPIEPERLEAIPQTRLCAEHARQIAQYGGEFRATATAEGTGQKTGRGVVAVNQ